MLVKDTLNGLKEYIKDYLQAEIRQIDIWDIEIICKPEVGCVKTVVSENGRREKKPRMETKRLTGENVVARSFTRKMSNYCSIGIDARIGLGFDKSRSGSRFCNKVIYAWEGLKKFLKPKVTIDTVIEKMEILESFVSLKHTHVLKSNSDDFLDMAENVEIKGVPKAALLPFGVENESYLNKRPAQDKQIKIEEKRTLIELPNDSKINNSQEMFTSLPLIKEASIHPSPPIPIISPSPTTNAVQSKDIVKEGDLDEKENQTLIEKQIELRPNERVINGYRVQSKEIFRTGFHHERTLTINPINLIALNIPSYMGGIANMWGKASSKAPIKSSGGAINYSNKQDMGDGELEFLSFTSKLRFGVLERLLTGGGKRVAQGSR